MRQCHFLPANHSSQTIHNLVCFDTETKSKEINPKTQVPYLWFGWAAYTRTKNYNNWCKAVWFRFEEAYNFWEWVVSKNREKSKLFVICHNTNFDLPIVDVFKNLPLLGYKLKMAVIDGPPTILTWSKGTRKIVVLDSLNWFRMPLKKVGKLFGEEKEEMPDADKSQEDWDTYCKQDVQVLLTAMQKWLQFLIRNDFGGFAYTLASQSLRTYRHRFMSYQIGIHNNESAIQLERDGYMGGRNECWVIGEIRGGWKLFDVHSMYPSVMECNYYPLKLDYYSDHKDQHQLIQLAYTKCIMARVSLNTDEPAYALKRCGKLIFPIGQFDTVLSTNDFIYAYHKGHITKVHESTVYTRAPIFRYFVNEIYGMRVDCKLKGDLLWDKLYKILLNSLYGKFGQRGYIYKNFKWLEDLSSKVFDVYNDKTDEIEYYRQMGGLLQKLEEESESQHSFPAIAAHVTANARKYLYELAQLVGFKNVAYMDTDSLLIKLGSEEKLKHLIHPWRLGYLDEQLSFEEGHIWAPKDYQFGTEEKHKGIKKNAKHLPSGKYEQQQWSSLKGMLRKGDMSRVEIKLIEKELKRRYDKGIVHLDGRVTPIVLPEA